VRVYGWTGVLVATIVIPVGLRAANTRRVRLSWEVGDTTARLVWIILAAALVGWLAGIATSVVVRRRVRRESPYRNGWSEVCWFAGPPLRSIHVQASLQLSTVPRGRGRRNL
jgi:uncharacterized integral membrane protein